MKSLFYATLLLLTPAFSLAQTSENTFRPKWDLTAAPFVGVESSTSGSTVGNSPSNATTLNIDVSAGYISPYCQWEPLVSVWTRLISGSTDSSSIELKIGAAYNFSKDIMNSFVLGAHVGQLFDSFSSPGRTYDGFYRYDVFIAKRYQIFQNVTWSPEVYYQYTPGVSTTGSNGNTYGYGTANLFEVIPLKFSLLF